MSALNRAKWKAVDANHYKKSLDLTILLNKQWSLSKLNRLHPNGNWLMV